MAPATQPARQLATRLIDRERASGDPPGATAIAVHAACERVYRNLTRWVGADGARGLFVRALAEVQPKHPILSGITVDMPAAGAMEGIPESIRTHGDTPVAAALDSLLVALLALLARLIGDDMVVKLVEPTERNIARVDAGGTSQ